MLKACCSHDFRECRSLGAFEATHMPAVVKSMFNDELKVVISVRNFAKSSFSESCHLIFAVVFLNKLPVPPLGRAL